MAEPVSKPNKQQLKRALTLYSDSLLFWATNCAVKSLNRMHEEGTGEDFTNFYFREWKRLTRLMFLNIPALLVIEEVYKISEEVAEQTWSDLKIHEIKEEKSPMISWEWKSG